MAATRLHGRLRRASSTSCAPTRGSSSTRPEDLLVAYRDICKRADPELPRLFGTLPRLPYGVVPVPAYAEKSQTTAYYEPGSPAAGRPGHFFANTYDLRARPKWEMEALSPARGGARPPPADRARPGAAGHAGVPQARLLHRLRRGLGPVRGEPGRRDGLLQGPVLAVRPAHLRDVARHPARRGHRHARARLEPRSRPSTTSSENAGKAEHDIVVEVDRYIVWPGQALAYKIGELKIKELRARARARAGRAVRRARLPRRGARQRGRAAGRARSADRAGSAPAEASSSSAPPAAFSAPPPSSRFMSSLPGLLIDAPASSSSPRNRLRWHVSSFSQ